MLRNFPEDKQLITKLYLLRPKTNSCGPIAGHSQDCKEEQGSFGRQGPQLEPGLLPAEFTNVSLASLSML